LLSGDKVKLLSIGMEESYAGACSGAGRGAERLFKRIKPRCTYSKLLLSSSATKDNVINEMIKVCDSDLAIITYCGHGGQQSGRTNETDGKDEFLALYDKPLVDNEVWKIVSQAKGRVFMIFDCCNAATMFCDNWRHAKDSVMIAGLPTNSIDLICWAACDDGKVSYSVPGSGGFFTNSILKNASAGYTYFDAWDKISKDEKLSKYEIAKFTILKQNTGFKGKKLFS